MHSALILKIHELFFDGINQFCANLNLFLLVIKLQLTIYHLHSTFIYPNPNPEFDALWFDSRPTTRLVSYWEAKPYVRGFPETMTTVEKLTRPAIKKKNWVRENGVSRGMVSYQFRKGAALLAKSKLAITDWNENEDFLRRCQIGLCQIRSTWERTTATTVVV